MTLIELLIALILMAVMLGSLWTVYNTGLRLFYSEASRSGVKDEVGRALQTIGSELRQLTSVTGALDAGMTFTAGVNSDGTTDTVQYTWSGAAGAPLNRIVGSSTKAVVRSANSVSFSYYDSNNNLLSAPVSAAQVREVVIVLTAVDSNESFTLRTRADLRNL